MGWACGDAKNAYKILVGNPLRKRTTEEMEG
jgi:hypothetical protein